MLVLRLTMPAACPAARVNVGGLIRTRQRCTITSATDDYQARSSACERRFETVLDLMAIVCHELGADNSWRDPAPATSESALRIIQGDGDGQESPGNGPRDQAVQHAGRGTPELPLRSEQTCIAHKRTD
jgi:hypothetical protein